MFAFDLQEPLRHLFLDMIEARCHTTFHVPVEMRELRLKTSNQQ